MDSVSIGRGAFVGIHPGVEIDGDDDAGAESPARRDGDGIDQRSIDEPPAIEPNRWKEPRDGVGRPRRLEQIAALKTYFVTGAELGRDAGEAARQILDHLLAQIVVENPQDALAGDDAAMAELEIKEAPQPDLVQATGPRLEYVEPAGEVDSADERADRGAADDVRPDPCAIERPQDADMRPTAGDAAAER